MSSSDGSGRNISPSWRIPEEYEQVSRSMSSFSATDAQVLIGCDILRGVVEGRILIATKCLSSERPHLIFFHETLLMCNMHHDTKGNEEEPAFISQRISVTKSGLLRRYQRRDGRRFNIFSPFSFTRRASRP